MSDSRDGAAVLQSKREATRYRILVEIAQRQPAVSQREIADEVGVTAQAVSEHLGDLAEAGYVDRQARGRYEVTVEGVDWLISQTAALEAYVGRVSEEVLGDVAVDTAVAAADVTDGQRVALSMRDGVLTATPLDDASGDTDDASGDTDDASGDADETDQTADDPGAGATALAVTDAQAGTDVGVTEFEGVVDYDLGEVTVVEVPSVEAGGSRAVDDATLRGHAEGTDLVAAAGTEALAALRRAGVAPDVRFGTAEAVEEAATKGLDVTLVAVSDRVSAHTDRLRDSAVGYEVVDAEPS